MYFFSLPIQNNKHTYRCKSFQKKQFSKQAGTLPEMGLLERSEVFNIQVRTHMHTHRERRKNEPILIGSQRNCEETQETRTPRRTGQSEFAKSKATNCRPNICHASRQVEPDSVPDLKPKKLQNRAGKQQSNSKPPIPVIKGCRWVDVTYARHCLSQRRQRTWALLVQLVNLSNAM